MTKQRHQRLPPWQLPTEDTYNVPFSVDVDAIGSFRSCYRRKNTPIRDAVVSSSGCVFSESAILRSTIKVRQKCEQIFYGVFGNGFYEVKFGVFSSR